MNSRQKKQDKRARKVIAVLDKYPNEVATIPAVAEADAELRRRLGLLQPAVSKQLEGRQGTGATEHKNELEEPLIRQLVRAANALNLYYRKADDLPHAMALHLRPSDYQRMGQPELLAEAQDLADQLTAHIPALAHYGYKPRTGALPGDDEKLQTQVQAYGASLPGNSIATTQGKVGTATVRAVVGDLRTFLKGTFHSAVELLPDVHPDLYRLLHEALTIDDRGGKGNKKSEGSQGSPPTPE